ncbi:MAG: hypothetical protein R3F11_26705 [Verrucomicrobiales bacterium]
MILGEDQVARFANGKPRDALFFTLPCGKTSSAPSGRRLRLVLNHAPENNGRPAVELFQLYQDNGSPADLGERENLASAQPAKRDELLAALSRWLEQTDAQLPYKNAKVQRPGKPLPGAGRVPTITGRRAEGDRIEISFETGPGKSRILRADLIYTANGSDELRDRAAYEEWFRLRATVGDGIAYAAAPPGMTHAILCLRDENGFLIRSKELPPSHGPGSVRNFTIASDPADTFAWLPVCTP